MNLISRLLPILAAVCSAATSGGVARGQDDRISTELAEACHRLDADVEALKLQVLVGVDRLIGSAIGAGDQQQAAQLHRQRDAFITDSILPSCVPDESKRFADARRIGAARKERAYASAIIAFNAAAQYDLARHAQQALENLHKRQQPFEWIDLRSQIDLAQHARAGPWKWDGTSVTFESADRGLLLLPCNTPTPDEYQLALTLVRASDAGDIQVVFKCCNSRASLVLGGSGNTFSGIDRVNGKPANDNETTHRGPAFGENGQCGLVLTVKKGRVQAEVNGVAIIDWTTDPRSFQALTGLPDGASNMCIIPAAGSRFRIESILLRSLPPASTRQERRPVLRPPQATPEKLDLMPVGKKWEGRIRNIDCTITVVERQKGAVAFRVELINNEVWRFEFVEANNRLSELNLIHVRANPGHAAVAAPTNEYGSGWVNERGISFNYTWSPASRPRTKYSGAVWGR